MLSRNSLAAVSPAAAIGSAILLAISSAIHLPVHSAVFPAILLSVEPSIRATIFSPVFSAILLPVCTPIFLTNVSLREDKRRGNRWDGHQKDHSSQ
ncbi:MAG TPA: hypothetical protein VIR79_06210 [Nitrospira sp.]